ncbi:unnamed protein product [Calicophoron daubneyi]|uniref:Dehydrogenase/reductase SDR family member 1 n=1 Tax=Calicophoron daubneyi TaxID=300641 RepID=A0AAV2T4A8_CALDB
MTRLKNHVCLVTGASRGVGRGIALGLGENGATVYITARTMKPGQNTDSEGSLEETAAAINASGGIAIPVLVDHSDEKQVTELFNRIRREQQGRLDVLVNNAFAAVSFISKNHGKPYYEIVDCSPGEAWDTVNNVGLRNHYICSVLGTRMMLDYQKQQKQGAEERLRPGLIVNISSAGGGGYLFNTLYGVGKAAIDRMTNDMAHELKQRNASICVLSLWPGLVRTEHILRASKDEEYSKLPIAALLKAGAAEAPELSGRVIAALAAESAKKLRSRSGQVVLVSDVAHEYSIRQPDGSVPPHLRSLKYIMQLGGYSLARFIPSFIRLPKFLFVRLISWGSPT